MDQPLSRTYRLPRNKLRTKLHRSKISACGPPSSVSPTRENVSASNNEKVRDLRKVSFQPLPLISAPHARTEVSRSFCDEAVVENVNFNDSLHLSDGQVEVAGRHNNDLHHTSGIVPLQCDDGHRCHQTFNSATRCERYHPYRRRFQSDVLCWHSAVSDSETVDEYFGYHSCRFIGFPGVKTFNFAKGGSDVQKSFQSSVSAEISMDCEYFHRRYSRCLLSHCCQQGSSSCGRCVGDFILCNDSDQKSVDGISRSGLASACKRWPMCVRRGDAHERVTRWRVTLLVAGTLPPLQVSEICDLIEGSSCAGAGYSARSHDQVTGCLKVLTDLGNELHFPVVQECPLPCTESWTLELVSDCVNYVRKLLHFNEMAHLQRSASESYSSNVLPPMGLERTSRLYAFKLMKNEQENVRKLLPYFIEKSKTDDKYVPFRPRRLSASKVETANRKSDVCDVLMYRDPASKHDSTAPEGHSDSDTSQTIRLCGIPLGNRPLTTSGNLFCTMRRSGTMRFTSPPASPLLSAGGSPSSSPQRRLVDRDCSAPPGTPPTPPARAGDSLSSAPPIALFADRHDAKNTPQGPHVDHQALLQTLPSETSVGLIIPDDGCNSSPTEKDCEIICAGTKLATSFEKEPLDVRILPSADSSTGNETRQPEKDDRPETNSILFPDLPPSKVGLSDLSSEHENVPPQLDTILSTKNNDPNSVDPTFDESDSVLCNTINSIGEYISEVPNLDLRPERHNKYLEKSAFSCTINLEEHETVSDTCPKNASFNSEKNELEIAGITEQTGYQEMNVSVPAEVGDDQKGFDHAGIREQAFEKYFEENEAVVGIDVLETAELHSEEMNSPSKNMIPPQIARGAGQNMVSVGEKISMDAHECVNTDHEYGLAVCDPAKKSTIDISSADLQCTAPCDLTDIQGAKPDNHHNNFIVTENFETQDLSQPENVSELAVLGKLIDDLSYDSKSVDSFKLLENDSVTEPQQLTGASILEPSLPSVTDVQSSPKLQEEEGKIEQTSFVLPESHRDDLLCIGSRFRDSIPTNIHQNEASSEQDYCNLPVASKHLEIPSADCSQILDNESETKIDFDGGTSVPLSVFGTSEVITQLPKSSNWSDGFGTTNRVESYFEKSVNTFIDEDPDTLPLLLEEQTCTEPCGADGEPDYLPSDETGEVDRIVVNDANVTADLFPVSVQNQPSVEVSQFSTFIDNGFGPNELNIPASSERLAIDIDPLPSTGAINDVQVETFLTEMNGNSLQTNNFTLNMGITPMVQGNIEDNAGIQTTEEGKEKHKSLSNNGVSNEVTEMSVCTININPICTSASVLQTPTCDIQPNSSETRVLGCDKHQLAHISRPRRTCATDFNRGQALADRAAKIARMHGASPSKPRPFAFPADVIRSPSQVCKSPQSSYVNKEPNIDTCAIRSKSASPMTQKRVKRETMTKRLKSTSPNNRLRVSLTSSKGELSENSTQIENNLVPEALKPILTTESHDESKSKSFINTVYVRVPSTGDVNNSPRVSSPATYISNFTRVTYSDVTCNDKEVADAVTQKTVRTELKLPRVSLIEEVEKINDDLTRWASYIANKMLIEIFDFDSPEWKKDYFARVCPIVEKPSISHDFMPENQSCSHLAEASQSPDSASNDDSLSFAQETSKKEATASPGNSASSADRRTGREEDSTTSSSFSSEAWWGQGGPVAHREQLPLKEDVELVPQWPGLPVPSVPESDVDRAGYASDEDFEAMDEDMRRLEEKIRQFEHELEEDLEMSLEGESSHRMPNFGLLDKAKLRSSPLPTQYPPVCMKKTKHFSFMSKKDIDDYLKSDSESGSSSSSSVDDDLFFVKKKIKLKPGDRKCFSLDLKKRSLIEEYKSECLMKILSITETGSKTEKIPDDITSDSKIEERDMSEECLIENEFKMTGQYWRSEDGLAVVDSEGLADFYAGENPSGVCFIFEDESDDENLLEESIAMAFDEPDIPHIEPFLESCSIQTPTENTADSFAIPITRPSSKADKKSKFVSSFKNSFVKATKSIGPKFGGKLNESDYENRVQGEANSPSIDPASIISDILYGKTKSDKVTSKTIGAADDAATFPVSSESDACDSSIISGEYYASPAICVLSDEDSHVPDYNLFQQPSPRKEVQLVSSLSAPPPPIRKSSLDAVSTTTGSFRRQSGGQQEAAPRCMVPEIPRVLPPPPCVPPRTTTLNYYPIRPSGPRPPQSGS